MKLRKISVENVRSFLGREELLVDGDMSILIGPNGGGKPNLLDIAANTIKRHLSRSWLVKPEDNPAPGLSRLQFFENNELRMAFPKHRDGAALEQIIEITVEATTQDVKNIKQMIKGVEELREVSKRQFSNATTDFTASWTPNAIKARNQFTYTIRNNSLEGVQAAAEIFRQYLTFFEMYSRMRAEANLSTIPTPFVYLPVLRGQAGISTSATLHGYNEEAYKRPLDAASSKTAPSYSNLVIHRLAQIHRRLELSDGTQRKFNKDPIVVELREALQRLGYGFEFTLKDLNTNQYVMSFSKAGKSFSVEDASSGERELLSYVFAIYGLQVKDGLVFVDEPELHLHPRWQQTLLQLFYDLSTTTRNQFVMATHSPAFISPSSISYVSRVFNTQGSSKIVRLNDAQLPLRKNLFSIVNSQNNERIFFADKVVLVEGISDRIFFEAVGKHFNMFVSTEPTCEVIDVGGKNFFASYEKILNACKVPYAKIADRDYCIQLGDASIKATFESDHKTIKKTATNEQLIALRAFIKKKSNEGIFILTEGTLENYLPSPYQSKNVENIIKLTTRDNFWSLIPTMLKREIETITRSALKIEP